MKECELNNQELEDSHKRISWEELKKLSWRVHKINDRE